MKKKYFLILLLVSPLFFISCNGNDDPDLANPFDNSSESLDEERDKIVVISDLHLGNDLIYSENVKHLP